MSSDLGGRPESLDADRPDTSAGAATDDGRLALVALAVAAGAVICGGAALAVGALWTHVLGYGLASLAAFTLVAVARRRQQERQATNGVVPSRASLWGAVAVLVIGFLVSVAHAWFIARHFA